MFHDILTLPLYDALIMLCARGCPVRIEPVVPPTDVSTGEWRVVRVKQLSDETFVIAVVAETEGHIGCVKQSAQN